MVAGEGQAVGYSGSVQCAFRLMPFPCHISYFRLFFALKWRGGELVSKQECELSI